MGTEWQIFFATAALGVLGWLGNVAWKEPDRYAKLVFPLFTLGLIVMICGQFSAEMVRSFYDSLIPYLAPGDSTVKALEVRSRVVNGLNGIAFGGMTFLGYIVLLGVLPRKKVERAD